MKTTEVRELRALVSANREKINSLASLISDLHRKRVELQNLQDTATLRIVAFNKIAEKKAFEDRRQARAVEISALDKDLAKQQKALDALVAETNKAKAKLDGIQAAIDAEIRKKIDSVLASAIASAASSCKEYEAAQAKLAAAYVDLKKAQDEFTALTATPPPVTDTNGETAARGYLATGEFETPETINRAALKALSDKIRTLSVAVRLQQAEVDRLGQRFAAEVKAGLAPMLQSLIGRSIDVLEAQAAIEREFHILRASYLAAVHGLDALPVIIPIMPETVAENYSARMRQLGLI